jgi:hypothetical protein
VLLVSYLPEREAVSPKMTAAPVLLVECFGVVPVDTVEGAGECGAPALDDEVVVVRHQAEGDRLEVEPSDRGAQLGEKAASVLAVAEDALACDPARRDVPHAVVRKRRARKPRHNSKVGPASCSRGECG